VTGLQVLEAGFWLSGLAVAYGYAGYPLVLWALDRLRGAEQTPPAPRPLPSISMIVPVHNEESVIDGKIENTRALVYDGALQVLFVSDGSTDGTAARLHAAARQHDRIAVLELPTRNGKASALNAGLAHAVNDVVVFSDASIALEPTALEEIVRPFGRADVGCVSGEDRIAQIGGEGLYGRYELFLRRLESNVFSIVGASGSFYAQRRHLCEAFPAGLAPDFASVLQTVKLGYRAVSAPGAVGIMTALADPKAEFSRKVRTILRGISTLARYRSLLNPLRHPWFAFELFSHKLMRWLVPFFLLFMAAASLVLASESNLYRAAVVAQLLFYGSAALGAWASRFAAWLPVKISLYFTLANVATAAAWLRFFMGYRQEIWAPSRR
jgi:cellulose synthase/poly-beta-1,6-N-acetylglucosamine synthase-like glycosyltransferase